MEHPAQFWVGITLISGSVFGRRQHDMCRKKYFSKGQTVVFINTGGHAGLLPYNAPLKAWKHRKELALGCPAVASGS